MSDDPLRSAQHALWSGLSRLLTEGFSLVKAIEVAGAGCGHGPLAGVLGQVKDRVEQGATLSAALRGSPAFFPRPVANMVEAGERIGKLDTVASLIADGWLAGQWPQEEADAGPELGQPTPVSAGLLDEIIWQAVAGAGSDLHVEAVEHGAQFRVRVDGLLHDVRMLTAAEHMAVVARAKTLAGMDVGERRLPQQGRMVLEADGGRVEARVFVTPTAAGETVVMRLADKSAALTDLAELGLTGDQLASLEGWCAQPKGLILVTGPTGSGRSATLYALLQRLNDTTRKIATVEDSVEWLVPGLTQMEVRPSLGLSRAEALRVQLQQDPDVLMVSSIVDDEAAWLAVQAAMGGLLVFAALPTASAAAGMRRLVDMGVSPYLVNDAVLGVTSQRLVRLLCNACKAESTPTPDELDQMALPFHVETPQVFQPVGCDQCRGTGFRGRTGVFEVLELTDKTRQALEQNYAAADLHQIAVETGMRPLAERAVDQVLAGASSLAEAMRATQWG